MPVYQSVVQQVERAQDEETERRRRKSAAALAEAERRLQPPAPPALPPPPPLPPPVPPGALAQQVRAPIAPAQPVGAPPTPDVLLAGGPPVGPEAGLMALARAFPESGMTELGFRRALFQAAGGPAPGTLALELARLAGRGLEAADIPRRVLKERVYEPVIEQTRGRAREFLEGIGVPPKVAGPLVGTLLAPPGFQAIGTALGALSDEQAAEVVSWGLEPLNLPPIAAFQKTRQGIAAVLRARPAVARLVQAARKLRAAAPAAREGVQAARAAAPVTREVVEAGVRVLPKRTLETIERGPRIVYSSQMPEDAARIIAGQERRGIYAVGTKPGNVKPQEGRVVLAFEATGEPVKQYKVKDAAFWRPEQLRPVSQMDITEVFTPEELALSRTISEEARRAVPEAAPIEEAAVPPREAVPALREEIPVAVAEPLARQRARQAAQEVRASPRAAKLPKAADSVREAMSGSTPEGAQGLRDELGPRFAEVVTPDVPQPRRRAPALDSDQREGLTTLRGLREQGQLNAVGAETLEALEELERLGIEPIAGGQSPLTVLSDFLDEATRLAPEIAERRTQQAARYAGLYEALIGSGKHDPIAATRLASSMSKGSILRGLIRPEVRPNADDIRYLAEQVEEVGRRLGVNAFDRQTAVKTLTLKLALGTPPAPAERRILGRIFGLEFQNRLAALAAMEERSPGLLREVADWVRLPGAIASSLDQSFNLRQAVIQTISHPIQAIRVFARTYTPITFGLDPVRAAEVRWAAMEEDALFDFATKIGDLHLVSPTGVPAEPGVVIARRGRTVAGKLWDRALARIPFFGGSQLGFTMAGNDLRLSIFKEAFRHYGTRATPKEWRLFGRWMNVSTGVGELPGSVRDLASGVLWSPGLLIARIQSPYIAAQLLLSSPVFRWQVARDLASWFGFSVGLMTTLKMSGAVDIELDPRGTDGLRIRIGKQRFDLWGGYQPVVRTLARLAKGERKIPDEPTIPGGVIEINRLQELGLFALGKLNPSAQLLALVLGGPRRGGEKLEWDTALLNLVAPLFWQDMTDALRQEGFVGGGLATLGWFGVGVLTYDSPYDRVREAKNTWNEENGITEADLPAQPDLRRQRDADPRVRAASQELATWVKQVGGPPTVVAKIRRTELRDLQADEQGVYDAALGRGDMSVRTWQDRSDDLTARTHYRIEELNATLEREGYSFPEEDLPAGSVGEAVNRYYAVKLEDFTDPRTFEIDWDGFKAVQDAALGPDLDIRQRALTYIDGYKSPLRRREDRETAYIADTGYWEVRDAVARQRAGTDYSDLAQAAPSDRNAVRLLKLVDRGVTREHERLRRSNADLEVALYIWDRVGDCVRNVQARAILADMSVENRNGRPVPPMCGR